MRYYLNIDKEIKRNDKTEVDIAIDGYSSKGFNNHDEMVGDILDYAKNGDFSSFYDAVLNLRSMYPGVTEKSFYLYLLKKNKDEHVSYKNNKLYSYSRDINGISITYDTSNGLSVQVPKNAADVPNIYSNLESLHHISDTINRINKLKECKKHELDSEDKHLIQVYKLFYGEYPDFREEDINFKFQTMFLILSGFNICFYNDFKRLPNHSIPESKLINKRVDRLYQYKEIPNMDKEESMLPPEQIVLISTIGSNIKSHIGDMSHFDKEIVDIIHSIDGWRTIGRVDDISIEKNIPIYKVQKSVKLYDSIISQIILNKKN